MRSPDRVRVSLATLVAKELRELFASRAWWLLLALAGILVGQAFTSAASLYAEASGAGGGPSALSQGLAPLTGLVVPTLGAYDLVATLLFPFVVIRLVAAERESGALVLMLQAPVRFASVITAKAIALMVGWMLAGIPGVVALMWWRAIGGHLFAPEVATVALGHLLRGLLTIGIGAAAAALASSAASAAIAALAVTIGSWALDYAAAARGGVMRVAAQYTPAAALRVFERGELRASVILVQCILAVAGLAIAAAWLRIGRRTARRAAGVAAVLVATVIACAIATQFHASDDTSEARYNSFAPEDERALAKLTSPLVVTVHLSADDPRLDELERGVFAKLRRTLPSVRFAYVARGRSGMFEGADPHYGEVWYDVGGHRATSRSATEEIVLDDIYSAAGITPPTRGSTPPYPGYPLVTTPAGAPFVFYLLWPLLVAGAWYVLRGQRTRASLDA